MGYEQIYIPQVEDDSIASMYLKFNCILSNPCPIMQALEGVSEEGKPSIDPICLQSSWRVAACSLGGGRESIDSRKVNIIKRQLY